MNARFFMCALYVCLSINAFAVTGSAPSAVTPLETVSPMLQSAAAVMDRSLSATFSEPMLAPGVTTPGNYAVSGMGTGSLLLSPTGVSGGPAAFTLNWAAGEMRNDVSLTLMASGVQDALGNPLNPAANSAPLMGKGTAPVFINLTVMPPEAAAGDTVTISFTVSETLQADPEVTVNGHPATAPYGKADGYIFEYEVSDEDPLGLALIEVSGADLVGNLGTLSNGDLMEIVEEEAGLPLWGWPWAAALLLALGMFFTTRRSHWRLFRFFALLYVVHALACASAFADVPNVSNVTMAQSPTAASTQVDIYYDLVAPNGPCAIAVSLSKDGGTDGYPYPVTSITGDLANVTTGTGHHIVWDIRSDCPEEDLPNARILVTADDGAVLVEYYRDDDNDGWGREESYLSFVCTNSVWAAAPAYPYTATQCGDCDDTDPDIYPGAPEICNGLDDDCDGATDEDFDLQTDPQHCGFCGNECPSGVCQGGTCVPLTEYFRDDDHDTWGLDGDSVWAVSPVAPYTATHGEDCDDTDPDINPGAPEICNGLDDDCDGATDEDFDLQTDPQHCGFCGNECPSGVCQGGACVPLTEYFRDDDHDTWGLDGDSVWAVSPVAPYTATHGEDCDDTDPDINPGRTEVCCNGKDDDCDGMTDNPTQCTFTVTYLAGAGGSISGTTPQDLYNCASGSEVTAVPDTGYHFVDWSDGVATAARTDGNLTADLTVTANFAINTYTLTYLAGPNGSISGTTPQTVNHGASGTAVSAAGEGAYVFNQWSDGSTQNPRTDSNVTSDITVTASFALPTPVVTSLAINSGVATTMPLSVTLDNTATNSPTDYMASESPTFMGATWQPYATAPSFTLSFGVGTRTVYLKVRNGAGESGVVSDTIFIVPNTVSVGAGTFTMGRTALGDDATYGDASEDPQHSVTLGAYQFGKYEVTNKEYCDVLNWALAQGYLKTSAGAAWTGAGDIYAGDTGALYIIVVLTQTTCNIQYAGGVFSSKTRVGLPGTTNYSMDTHPMVRVSWYGSVALCNWLSQWQGLTPCYDMATALWPLTVAPPTSGGYRLPTEAEWERAAAWDASAAKHWIYSFLSDTNPSFATNRCNDFNDHTMYDNPLGLTTTPYTSPVGWFNGVNVNPRDGVTTTNSPSPVGAYDLSGNVWEWTHDWYGAYSADAQTNPTGPATGTGHVGRGGCWSYDFYNCRSAFRLNFSPGGTYNAIGFRIARS